MDELNVKLGDYCANCLHNPCDCKLDLHIVSNRTFKPNDPEVEEIAIQMDKFVEMYFENRKAGTYSIRLREYIADILNKYGC